MKPSTDTANIKQMKLPARAFAVVMALLLGCGGLSAQNGDRILGTYRVVTEETHEASDVLIYKKGDTYEAKVVWFENPLDTKGQPKLDVLNPDPALRSLPVDRIVILKGLRFNAKNGKWTGGRIYNPVTGKCYDAMAEFESPAKLKMKGYLGMPALGKTFIWTRTK